MKAWRQAETLVEQAERVLCDSRKLVEQREAQLKQPGRFLEQRGTITDDMLRDAAIRVTSL